MVMRMVVMRMVMIERMVMMMVVMMMVMMERMVMMSAVPCENISTLEKLKHPKAQAGSSS